MTIVDSGPVNTMLLPSSLIMSLHRYYPEEFRKCFGADPNKVRSFWSCMLSSPTCRDQLRLHSVLGGLSLDELSYMIPLSLHEDAGPITKRLSANHISFSSLLSEGNEKLTHFLICTHVKKKGDNLQAKMWEILLGDMDGLSCGVVNGSTVAPAGPDRYWKFLVLFCKCDEECRCNMYGFAHWGASDEVCSECLCNRCAMPFTDLQVSAAWRPTEIKSIDQYKGRVRQPCHPLIGSKYFWRFMFYLDMMHVMDCKGVSSLVYGGLVATLLADVRLGPNQNTRLRVINDKMKAWYTSQPQSYRLPPILMNNVYASGWADLSGPAIKAATTRHAAGFFKDLAFEYFASQSPNDVAMRGVTYSLLQFYDILARSERILSKGALARVSAVCLSFGTAYQRLRGIAEQNNKMYFPVKPKCHKMQHFPLLARICNPFWLTCYADESQVGTTCLVWKRSVAGRWQSHAQFNVVVKRFLAFALRLELAKARMP